MKKQYMLLARMNHKTGLNRGVQRHALIIKMRTSFHVTLCIFLIEFGAILAIKKGAVVAPLMYILSAF